VANPSSIGTLFAPQLARPGGVVSDVGAVGAVSLVVVVVARVEFLGGGGNPDGAVVEEVAGIVDDLTAARIKVFGPSKAAAQLEGSKIFTCLREFTLQRISMMYSGYC